MTSIERLDQWCRKHYSYTIDANGFAQPGDGHVVTLMAGGRKVQADEYDLVEPTLDQIINHALDLWEQDQTPKNFHVFFTADHNITSADHWHNKTWMWKVTAPTEEAARQMLLDAYKNDTAKDSVKILQVWEMTSNWTH